MAAAEHGANFPMARKVRASMTHQQMHDFASGPMKGKPAHVHKPDTESHGALLKGDHPIRNLKHFAHPRKKR